MTDKHTSATLPLPFNLAIKAQPGDKLPLTFVRKLGTLSPGPTPPPKPDDPKTRRVPVAADWRWHTDAVADEAHCLRWQGRPHGVALPYSARYGTLSGVVSCLSLSVETLRSLQACRRIGISQAPALAGCGANRSSAPQRLAHCRSVQVGISPPLVWCSPVVIPAARPRYGCRYVHHQPARLQAACTKLYGLPRAQEMCRYFPTTPARRPPGQFYPQPLPDPPPTPRLPRACGPVPPGDKLQLNFLRRHVRHHPTMLPLPFACGYTSSIPILTGYVMHIQVTAEADGKPIQALSARLRTDTGSFCWQGSVTLYPDDFAALKMDERERGKEAIITLTINGEPFAFMAEDYSDNREFGRRTYTVSGRSVTARLAADYAKTKSGVVQSRLYARQLAAEQLQFLPYTLTFWDIPDWLIPGGSYSIGDKTPMDVLRDIASAAGGFVESHPSRAQLSLRPHWKTPAWQLDVPVADVTVPDSVIVSVSGQKRIQPRYERVLVWADHANGVGADVYRNNADRSAEAPSLIHPLYTDLPVCRAAGTAALSDSGTHKTETVKLPLSDEYSLPRAKLGQIWQFNEPTGRWRGVVQGVDLEVSRDSNGAIALWQTLTIDRYLDK